MKSKSGNPNIAVGYLRVSTEEQHLGPEAQKDALERWSKATGVTLVAVFQEAISGGAGLDQRIQLLAAIDHMKTNVSIAAHSVPPSVHPVCTTHVHP